MSEALKRIPWRGIGIGLAFAGVALSVFLAYKHYTGLLEANRTLTANNAVLQTSIDQQSETILAQAKALSEWQQALAAFQQTAEELRTTSIAARQEVRRLNDIFERHDLRELALKKPGLIENRINAGSDRAMLMLECATDPRRDDCTGGDSDAGPPALRP